MNKKLRRLLRRGRRTASDDVDLKNKMNKPSLPSLLNPRSAATPNYYFRSDESSKGEAEDLKDEKKDSEKDLIVLPDVEIVEDRITEVSLLPLRNGPHNSDDSSNRNQSRQTLTKKCISETKSYEMQPPEEAELDAAVPTSKIAKMASATLSAISTDHKASSSLCEGKVPGLPLHNEICLEAVLKATRAADVTQQLERGSRHTLKNFKDRATTKCPAKIFPPRNCKIQNNLPAVSCGCSSLCEPCTDANSLQNVSLQPPHHYCNSQRFSREANFFQHPRSSCTMDDHDIHHIPWHPTMSLEQSQANGIGTTQHDHDADEWRAPSSSSHNASGDFHEYMETDAHCDLRCNEHHAQQDHNLGFSFRREQTQLRPSAHCHCDDCCTSTSQRFPSNICTHRCTCSTHTTSPSCCRKANQCGDPRNAITSLICKHQKYCLECSRTDDTAQKTRSSVLITIVDEGTPEQLPRILEFESGNSRAADFRDSCSHHRHQQHVMRSQNCHRCGTNGCELHGNRAYKRHLDDSNRSNLHNGVQLQNRLCLKEQGHSSQIRFKNMPPSIGFCNDVAEQATSTSVGQHNAATACCQRATVRDVFMNNPNGYPSSDIYALAQDRRRSDEQFFGPPQSLQHFKLSQRGYEKLIGYCQARKILPNLQSSTPERFIVPDDATIDLLTPENHMHQMSRLCSEAQCLPFNGTTRTNQSINEMCCLARVLETVEECPWYWGNMSGPEAKKILKKSSPGTFLLRDSSDPRYLFSLSLMTRRGPTSMRIVYSNGLFRFDSDRDNESGLRQDFSTPPSGPRPRGERRHCVIHMILHYTRHLITREAQLAEDAANGNSRIDNCPPGRQQRENGFSPNEDDVFMCYWMERNTRMEIPVFLAQPQPHSSKPHSLQQLSRQAISKHLRLWKNPQMANELPLPEYLQHYIRKYPYPA